MIFDSYDRQKAMAWTVRCRLCSSPLPSWTGPTSKTMRTLKG